MLVTPFEAANDADAARTAEAADVLAAGTGDRRAFERLYRTHVDRVFSLCVRMAGDRTQAEELTQDVFVRAWERLTSFRGESAFGTWLYRLAVNVVLNARKTAGRQRARFADGGRDEENGGEHELYEAVAKGSGDGPGTALDLEAAIAALPPGARRVFVLHDVQGYRHEEIAEMLGITSGGSKAQLHRARLLLRGALER
jgi:RNA polymerase sigma-70 factor (ECF subfamily)